MKPGKSGLTRLIEATGHSIRGVKACWQHETAFRLDVILGLILLALSFFRGRVDNTVDPVDRTVNSAVDRGNAQQRR